MLFTVSTLAAHLAPSKEQPGLKERIRHWTREGLLTPVGEKNPGTGRHRLYEESVLVDVAILNALAGLGIQVRGQHEVLRRAKKALKDWASTIELFAKEPKEGSIVYLEISTADAGLPPYVRVYRADLIDPRRGTYSMEPHWRSTASLYINISRIQQMIETGKF